MRGLVLGTLLRMGHPERFLCWKPKPVKRQRAAPKLQQALSNNCTVTVTPGASGRLQFTGELVLRLFEIGGFLHWSNKSSLSPGSKSHLFNVIHTNEPRPDPAGGVWVYFSFLQAGDVQDRQEHNHRAAALCWRICGHRYVLGSAQLRPTLRPRFSASATCFCHLAAFPKKRAQKRTWGAKVEKDEVRKGK